MSGERIETRGRKKLADEPTIRAGVCLPLSLYDTLVSLGEKSGKGYGHHIREACDAKFTKKVKRKKTKKKIKK